MDLVGTKVVVLFLLLFIKLISGSLPYFILKRLKAKLKGKQKEKIERRKKRLEQVIYGVSCFGGGVLLAVVLLHMLPEARESLNTAREQREQSIEVKGMRYF